jgi:YidC/Oxa1 family membrane protein insertase
MWDTFILNPLINAMIWLYGLFGDNYLLAVVTLTVIIRMATFPLTWQQLKSSTAMQEIQPKVQELRDKYKGEPETLNAKTMELYREHKINPLGGCLPTIVQFPILIGLYQAITRSLAASPLQLLDLSQHLYQTVPAFLPSAASLIPLNSNALWLNLAAPDPLPVLPILVVATTWLQQRLMTPPTSGGSNDQQATMMKTMQVTMPLFIGFYSTIFPSGLSIYWIVSNVIGILQYAAIGRASIKNLLGTEDGSFSWSALLGLPQPQTAPPSGRGRSGGSRSKKRRK